MTWSIPSVPVVVASVLSTWIAAVPYMTRTVFREARRRASKRSWIMVFGFSNATVHLALGLLSSYFLRSVFSSSQGSPSRLLKVSPQDCFCYSPLWHLSVQGCRHQNNARQGILVFDFKCLVPSSGVLCVPAMVSSPRLPLMLSTPFKEACMGIGSDEGSWCLASNASFRRRLHRLHACARTRVQACFRAVLPSFKVLPQEHSRRQTIEAIRSWTLVFDFNCQVRIPGKFWSSDSSKADRCVTLHAAPTKHSRKQTKHQCSEIWILVFDFDYHASYPSDTTLRLTP